jgi:hypothetical protein
LNNIFSLAKTDNNKLNSVRMNKMTNDILNDNNYEKIIQSQNRHHKKHIIAKKNYARFICDISEVEDYVISSGILCDRINKISHSLS